MSASRWRAWSLVQKFYKSVFSGTPCSTARSFFFDFGSQNRLQGWQNFVKKLSLLTPRQSCIILSILPSGLRARGVNSEHVRNMENFACLFKGTTVFFSFKHTYLHHFSWRQYQYPNVNTIQSKHIGKLVTYPPPPRNPSNSVVIIMQFPLLSLPWMTASCSARAQPCHGYPILHWLSHWNYNCKLWQVQLA